MTCFSRTDTFSPLAFSISFSTYANPYRSKNRNLCFDSIDAKIAFVGVVGLRFVRYSALWRIAMQLRCERIFFSIGAQSRVAHAAGISASIFCCSRKTLKKALVLAFVA